MGGRGTYFFSFLQEVLLNHRWKGGQSLSRIHTIPKKTCQITTAAWAKNPKAIPISPNTIHVTKMVKKKVAKNSIFFFPLCWLCNFQRLWYSLINSAIQPIARMITKKIPQNTAIFQNSFIVKIYRDVYYFVFHLKSNARIKAAPKNILKRKPNIFILLWAVLLLPWIFPEKQIKYGSSLKKQFEHFIFLL